LELYNLRNDISEANNLATAMPQKATALHKMLDDWRRSVGAAIPGPNPGYKPPQ
jgi:hypothetical protein